MRRRRKTDKVDSRESRTLILRELRRKPGSINEVLDRIANREIKSGKENERAWDFYVHLNKLPTHLKRKGNVEVIGTQVGLKGKTEEILGFVKWLA